MPLFIGLIVIISILAIFAGIYLTLGPDGLMEDRLVTHHDPADKSSRNALKHRVNAQITKGRWGAGLNVALFQAGVKLTAVEFLSINGALITFLFLVGWMIGRNVLSGVGLALIMAFAPSIWLKRKKEQRLAKFQEQLPDVLNLLVGSLRSGYGMMQSLRLVAQEMPSPSREEYERVTQEIAFGIPSTKALGNLVERMESSDLEMVVAAIQVQNEVGGNLGDILAQIAATIRERIEIQGQIRSITGMQRGTGYMLAAMPVILGVILMLINPTYMMRLFAFPWFLILVFAGISIVMGLFMMNRMVNSIEV
ncbi:MAG: type II secretion system F family protein [Caldilineaceae bacterium]|nr:type II secretion system F family protein [Caldilineaceae bacterium]